MNKILPTGRNAAALFIRLLKYIYATRLISRHQIEDSILASILGQTVQPPPFQSLKYQIF